MWMLRPGPEILIQLASVGPDIVILDAVQGLHEGRRAQAQRYARQPAGTFKGMCHGI